jgi:general secretion pathway protein K
VMSLTDLCKNNRGVALILAVAVISLLIAVTVQFSKEMRQELMSSANGLSINTLEIMAKSGYNLAEAVLQADVSKEEVAGDTLQDNWAILKDQEMSPLYQTATLDIAITDLSGRVQLNSLLGSADGGDDAIAARTAALLKRLLLSEDLPEVTAEQADLIIQAISNWIDKDDDDEEGFESTESSFYRGLQPSYASKNGPMEFVEELLLIRGITRLLYYGNEEFVGLRDLVTVHGTDGTINLNTAPKAVLKAMSPSLNEALAAQLVAFREDEKNRELLNGKMWYEKVLPGDVVMEINSDMLVTESTFFQIIARAENNGMGKILSATVQRKPDKTIGVLSRRLE